MTVWAARPHNPHATHQSTSPRNNFSVNVKRKRKKRCCSCLGDPSARRPARSCSCADPRHGGQYEGVLVWRDLSRSRRSARYSDARHILRSADEADAPSSAAKLKQPKIELRKPEELLKEGRIKDMLQREMREELIRRGLSPIGKPWELRARLHAVLEAGWHSIARFGGGGTARAAVIAVPVAGRGVSSCACGWRRGRQQWWWRRQLDGPGGHARLCLRRARRGARPTPPSCAPGRGLDAAGWAHRAPAMARRRARCPTMCGHRGRR